MPERMRVHRNSESFALTGSNSSSSELQYGYNIPQVQFNRNVSKKRIAIICTVALVVIVALAIGLGVGLRKPPNKRPPAPRGKWIDQPCRKQDMNSCPAGYSSSSVLLISLDGFRAEYLLRNMTPVIQRLGSCGVRVPYMRAAFPTKTFPNHYTIVTGLYPESHGIVGNTFYDPDLKKEFRVGRTSGDGQFWGGDPMWLTAQRQGKKTATFFWPGSDVKIKGKLPNYWKPYNRSVPFETRVDTVLTWLDKPKNERPEFITLYMEEPDSMGHKMEPYEKINPALQDVDRMIGRLMDGLLQRNLHNCINVIILADHGMEEVACSKRVMLNKLVNTRNYYIVDGAYGSMTSQYVYSKGIIKNENPVPVEKTLSDLECKDDHMNVFDKNQFPKRHHYSNSKRIGEVTVDMATKWLVKRSKGKCKGGSHGWDNAYKSMHAIFTSHGPAFKVNYTTRAFENIEVYNMMAEILGVAPSPNNGTRGSLHHILATAKPFPTTAPPSNGYVNYTFPNREEYNQRVNRTDCLCNFSNYTDKTLELIDGQLNLTQRDIGISEMRHLTFGQPWLDLTDTRVGQLTQKDYISGYSEQHHMLMWAAFTITNQTGSISSESAACVRGDVRLHPELQTNCSAYEDASQNISAAYLFPPDFSSNISMSLDARIATNIVPMYNGFRKGIWKEMLELIQEYSGKYRTIHVTAGPVFDQDSDSNNDQVKNINRFVNNGSVPLPTHYYVVMAKCLETSSRRCAPADMDVQAFILPHNDNLRNCMKGWDYMRDNAARMRDVELVTGLRFFPKIKAEDSVRLKTFLPESLWEKYSWMDDQTCGSQLPQCPVGFDPNSLLLISLDGFKAAYTQRRQTPVLTKMMSCGVHTPYMRSVYPSLTFPNHYSIVTGLYPESHGIVSNSMYDMDIGKPFRLYNKEKSNPRWWQGDPLWNVAERQNKTSATCFWPGSDVTIANMTPSYWLPYQGSLPFEKRVDQVLSWLDLPKEKRPSFLTLYMEQPDKSGHSASPKSIKVDEGLQLVDTAIKQLMDGLYRRNLHNCLNVIVLADHGMAEISCDRVVLLNKYLNLTNLYAYTGAAGRISNRYRYSKGKYIHLNETQKVPVKNIFEKLECKTEVMDLYERKNLVRRLHYSNNKRIEDVVLDMKDKWLVYRENRTGLFCEGGQHGYDPLYESMQALFLAHGPAFKKETMIQPFENIELYNVMAEVLNITAPSNNGTQGSLYHMLREQPALPDTPLQQNYTKAAFPGQDEYWRRANSSDCECTPPDNTPLWRYDIQLNLTDDEASSADRRHLLMGRPGLMFTRDDDRIHILAQAEFLTAFSQKMKIPLWTAYQIDENQIKHTPVPSCHRPDIRLESSIQINCSDWNKVDVQLARPFKPEFSSNGSRAMDALTFSNVVPMMKGFHSGIWSVLMNNVEKWVMKYKQLKIITGPIFDHNADGLPDEEIRFFSNSSIPYASHYYMVAMKCAGGSADCSQYDILSFILRHTSNVTNCQTNEQHLMKNVARVRDIELLTGIQFFTDKKTQEAIQMRTYLPTDLWPSQ